MPLFDRRIVRPRAVTVVPAIAVTFDFYVKRKLVLDPVERHRLRLKSRRLAYACRKSGACR